MITPSIFKAYDIRGIYPSQLNESNISDIVAGIYTLYTKDFGRGNLRVVVGHDMRVSSPALYAIATKTLVDLGAQVLGIGQVSTPTMYFATTHLKADAGMSINASHNSKEWNGVKFAKVVDGKMIKVSDRWATSAVRECIESGDLLTPTSGGSLTTYEHMVDTEIATINADSPLSLTKKYKVVVDPANGMGCVNVKRFLQSVGIDPIMINDGLDGTFPNHQSDPLQFELYKELQERVVSEGADFGIAPDGDADRVFFVDEKGAMIPATYITSLVSREILREYPGATITVDVRYIHNVSRNVSKYGGKTTYTKVGHAFITKHLNDTGSLFAGESSGHYFFASIGGGESTLMVISILLKALTSSGKPLSALIAEFHQSNESGETNYTFPATLTANALLDAVAAYSPGAQVDRMDGISLTLPTWRASIRIANTEPLARLNVEADDTDILKAEHAKLVAFLLSLGCTPKTAH